MALLVTDNGIVATVCMGKLISDGEDNLNGEVFIAKNMKTLASNENIREVSVKSTDIDKLKEAIYKLAEINMVLDSPFFITEDNKYIISEYIHEDEYSIHKIPNKKDLKPIDRDSLSILLHYGIINSEDISRNKVNVICSPVILTNTKFDLKMA